MSKSSRSERVVFVEMNKSAASGAEKPYARGRPLHPEYHKLGFRRIKVDGKSSVVCELCKCVLQNTATKRLRGHRNVCPIKQEGVKQEYYTAEKDEYIEIVNAKDEDPLNSYTRTNSNSYIELQPPSPTPEYAEYSDYEDEPPSQQVHRTEVKTRSPAVATPSVRKTVTRLPVRTSEGAASSSSENVVDVVKQIFESLGGMLAQQKSTSSTADPADEAFCNWLLTQFSTMPGQQKLRLQHEISNMVFRVQTDEGSSDIQ